MNKKIILLVISYLIFQLVISIYYGIYANNISEFGSQIDYFRYLMMTGILGMPLVLEIGIVFVLIEKFHIQSVKITTIILASLITIVTLSGVIITMFAQMDIMSPYISLATVSLYFQIPIFISLVVLVIFLFKSYETNNYTAYLTLGVLVYSVLFALYRNIPYFLYEVFNSSMWLHSTYSIMQFLNSLFIIPVGFVFLGIIVVNLLRIPKRMFTEVETGTND